MTIRADVVDLLARLSTDTFIDDEGLIKAPACWEFTDGTFPTDEQIELLESATVGELGEVVSHMRAGRKMLSDSVASLLRARDLLAPYGFKDGDVSIAEALDRAPVDVAIEVVELLKHSAALDALVFPNFEDQLLKLVAAGRWVYDGRVFREVSDPTRPSLDVLVEAAAALYPSEAADALCDRVLPYVDGWSAEGHQFTVELLVPVVEKMRAEYELEHAVGEAENKNQRERSSGRIDPTATSSGAGP